MREHPRHKDAQELQETFDSLRSMIKATDFYNRPGHSLVLGTGIAFILSLPFILFHVNKTKQKNTRLIATSPRSTLDYLAKLTSDVFAFIIFPLFFVGHIGLITLDGSVLTFGYFLHITSGCLYLITGGLQFYTPLRQRYPIVHRYMGYIFYIMVLIMSVGLMIVTVRPISGFPTQMAILTFLPPWVIGNMLAFRAIVFFKDVELHR